MNEYLADPKLDQPIFTNNPYLSALIGIIRYKKKKIRLEKNS